MKIALIGATGFIGSAVLQEALNREHQVTAIVRHPEKLPQHSNLVAQKGDVTNELETTALVVGHEAVISAYSPGRDVPDVYQQHIFGYRKIISGAKKGGRDRHRPTSDGRQRSEPDLITRLCRSDVE